MKGPSIKKKAIFVLLLLLLIHPAVGAQEAPNETSRYFTHEELAQLLAPIALYPDPLLSQILIAAAYPFEIVEAERWLAGKSHLTGESLDKALLEKDWDVSVLSLCHYPEVLSMLCENLDWTAKLGNAFVHQQEEVMDTIQELRAEARAQGNLVSASKQQVIVEEKIIRIEPAYVGYVHVPVYDPFLVYGTWLYPAYPPHRIYYPGVTIVGSRIAFSTGFHVGFGVIGWSMFDWPAHNVFIVNIDRTKRFNRNCHLYHGSPKVGWKPVQEKRLAHYHHSRPLRSPSVHLSAVERHHKTTASNLPVTTRTQFVHGKSISVRSGGRHSIGQDRISFSRERATTPRGETRVAEPPTKSLKTSSVTNGMMSDVKGMSPGVRSRATETRLSTATGPSASKKHVARNTIRTRSSERNVTGRNIPAATSGIGVGIPRTQKRSTGNVTTVTRSSGGSSILGDAPRASMHRNTGIRSQSWRSGFHSPPVKH